MKKRLISTILILISIFTIFLTACGENQKEVTISVGSYYSWQLGEGYDYSSSNENIATVDNNGRIFGVSEGECEITAKQVSKKQTLIVKVVKGSNQSSSSSSSIMPSSSSSSESSISSSTSISSISSSTSSSSQSDTQNSIFQSTTTSSSDSSVEEIESSSEDSSSSTSSSSSSLSSSSSEEIINGFTATCFYQGQTYSVATQQDMPFDRPSVFVEEGYFIEWFTTSDYQTSYNFATPATQDITLYGQKFKELDKSFFGYENDKVTEINSLEDFQYYLEYTFFNEITADNYVKDNIGIYDMLKDDTTRAGLINKTTCPFINLAYSQKIEGEQDYVEIVTREVVPQEFSTQDGIGTRTQLDYAEFGKDSAYKSSRAENFNDFAYLDFAEEVNVKNSNQLFFALEHRIKPIAVSGSNAEIALEKCKTILRKICDDSMSDIEKALAIYKYLIMNTEYVLPTEKTQPDVLFYDAFYMEGILNNGAGVCDGIAKTYSALCNIEGIRCVRTASTTHAWNEIFISGKWYVVDVTHGNVSMGGDKEVTSFANFLITDTLKNEMTTDNNNPYIDSLRTEIVAENEFNYYAWQKFSYKNKEYDYVISSQEELNTLMAFCKEQADTYFYSSFTVEFSVDFNIGVSISTELSTAVSYAELWGYNCSSSEIENGTRTIYLIIFS